MSRIVTLTLNPSIDTSSSVQQVVAERKLRCSVPRHEPGGGGINVSRAIHRLGGESIALYPAGGTFGVLLQNLLIQEGLQHRPFQIEGSTRENFAILEELSGQQYRFGMPGPMLQEEEWKRFLEMLSALEPKPGYIVASGSLPPEGPKNFFARVAEIAKEEGARLVVDTFGEALRWAIRAGVYLVKPNLRELQILAGTEIDEESHLEAAAQELVESGKSEVVVVSLGAAGALLVSKEGKELIRSPHVPIRSKVGAGDSMVGGIVMNLARGRSLREAVCFGVAAGAAAVMTAGTELCRREDTERLYQEMVEEKPETTKGAKKWWERLFSWKTTKS